MSPVRKPPSFGEDGGVLLGPVVVADHHVRAVDDDFALLARRSSRRRAAVDVSISMRTPGMARPTQPMRRVAGAVGRRDGARLGEAVALVDGDARG